MRFTKKEGLFTHKFITAKVLHRKKKEKLLKRKKLCHLLQVSERHNLNSRSVQINKTSSYCVIKSEKVLQCGRKS